MATRAGGTSSCRAASSTASWTSKSAGRSGLAAEAAQRSVDGGQDVPAGEPPVVRSGAGRVIHLGRQDVVIAVAEELGEQASGDLFARTVAVHIGGIEEGYAKLDRCSDKRLSLIFG